MGGMVVWVPKFPDPEMWIGSSGAWAVSEVLVGAAKMVA